MLLSERSQSGDYMNATISNYMTYMIYMTIWLIECTTPRVNLTYSMDLHDYINVDSSIVTDVAV